MTTALRNSPKIDVRGHQFLPAYPSRRGLPGLKTGDPEVDATIDGMDPDEEAGDILLKKLNEAIEAGKRSKSRSVSVDEALWSAIENGSRNHGDFMPTGDSSDCMTHSRTHRAARSAAVSATRCTRRERRNLTAGAGAGSISPNLPARHMV